MIYEYDSDLKFCVFCHTTTYNYTCHECGDYKGLMEIKSAEEYLDEDLTEYLPVKNV